MVAKFKVRTLPWWNWRDRLFIWWNDLCVRCLTKERLSPKGDWESTKGRMCGDCRREYFVWLEGKVKRQAATVKEKALSLRKKVGLEW